jgi:hypothetical protein
VWSSSALELSRDVSADADILCNKTAVFGDTIKGTFCLSNTGNHVQKLKEVRSKQEVLNILLENVSFDGS